MVKPSKVYGKTVSAGRAQVDVREEPKAETACREDVSDEFVKRRTEVAEKDHAEFQTYLVEKKEADARKSASFPGSGRACRKEEQRLSRRTMLNVAVGTAGAAEAAVLGYKVLGAGRCPITASARRRRLRPRRAQHRARGRRQPRRMSGGRASATGSPCCRPSWVAAPTRSTSIPTGFSRRSGTGTTATTIRSATISAPSRAPIRIMASSSSTRRRAARMR